MCYCVVVTSGINFGRTAADIFGIWSIVNLGVTTASEDSIVNFTERVSTAEEAIDSVCHFHFNFVPSDL